MDQPPCFKPGHALNACARALYAVQVTQHQDFAGPWLGWKMRGKEIVSPDGDRICPERLRGLHTLPE